MLSGCTITRNALSCGMPFVETILAIIDICDELVVGDDSTDGTREVLDKMAQSYSKLRVINTPWPIQQYREGAISVVTNQVIDECKEPWTLHVQADEVMHPYLLNKIIAGIEENSVDGFSFLRAQIGRNFQEYHHSGIPSMELAPGSLLRLGRTHMLRSTGDGLQMVVTGGTDKLIDETLPVHLWDISKVFVQNFADRVKNQALIWWGSPDNCARGMWDKDEAAWKAQLEEWDREGYPEIYERTVSPFGDMLPPSLLYWIGKKKYYAREELVNPGGKK